MRKKSRTQRIGSGAALPDTRNERGQSESGKKRHRESPQSPVRPGNPRSVAELRSARPEPVIVMSRLPYRRTSVAIGLIGQEPRPHPGDECSHHPPDGMVPPVAPPADFIPAIGVGPDILQQHDIHQEKHASRASPIPAAPQSLDGARPSPEARKHADGGSPTIRIIPETMVSTTPPSSRRGQGEQEFGNALEQAEA